MRLDPYARDFGPFTDELDGVLADEATRLYLDTSLLMWLVRVGREARREFIGWCKARPEGTVRVPVWAAHELHRHLIRGSISSNVQAVLSDTEKKLSEFAALANERADDELCRSRGYADRGSFVSTMEQTVARVKSLSNVIRLDEHIAEASDDIVAFVNDHILNTDLAPIVERLSRSGDLRFSHLMPPGYLDRKEENKFGDLVIWEEMLADLPRRQSSEADAEFGVEGSTRPSAVLLSRDEKTDWVSSAPAIRQDGEGKAEKSNRALGFDVTRPHPLLIHEFSVRTGGNQLYVVHPGVFASVLDYGVRKHRRVAAVTNLLAAAYRPAFLERLATAKLVAGPEPRTGAHPRSPEAEPFVSPPLTAVMALSLSDRLRSYEEATPPDQDAMAQVWTDELRAGAIAPLEYGRLAAELVLLNRPEWRSAALATLEALTPPLTEGQLNLVVTAMLFTGYFDRFAEPLRHPRQSLAELALSLEDDVRFKPAFEALAGALADKEVELPYIPGAGRRSVPYLVDLAPGNQPRLVRDIRVGDQSVLEDPIVGADARLLGTLMGKQPSDHPTGKDLRALISRIFLIPFDRLDDRFDKQKITWSPTAGLVVLDTASPGGVSATTDEGEDDE
jgi:hypothetical protein